MRRNKAAGDRPQEDLKPTLSTAGNAEGGATEKIYFGEKQNLRRQAGRKPVSRKNNALLVIPRTSSRHFCGKEGTRNLNRFKVNIEIPHSFQGFGMTTEANDKLLLLFFQ